MGEGEREGASDDKWGREGEELGWRSQTMSILSSDTVAT